MPSPADAATRLGNSAVFRRHDPHLLAKTRQDALADGTVPSKSKTKASSTTDEGKEGCVAEEETDLAEFDRVATETWLDLHQDFTTTYTQFKRRLDPNPPAAEVHKTERGAPWRQEGERKVEEANRRAQPELERRRAVNLARQTSQGLWNTYEIRYDYSDLAPILADAIKLKNKVEARDREYRQQLEEVLSRRKKAEKQEKDKVAQRVEAGERHRLKQEKLDAMKVEQANKKKPVKKKGGKGKSSPEPDELSVDHMELSEEDEQQIQAAVDKATKEVDLSDEYPAPSQPELSQKESEYIQLADAAFKFDIPRVKNILKLKAKDKMDTVLSPEMDSEEG